MISGIVLILLCCAARRTDLLCPRVRAAATDSERGQPHPLVIVVGNTMLMSSRPRRCTWGSPWLWGCVSLDCSLVFNNVCLFAAVGHAFTAYRHCIDDLAQTIASCVLLAAAAVFQRRSFDHRERNFGGWCVGRRVFGSLLLHGGVSENVVAVEAMSYLIVALMLLFPPAWRSRCGVVSLRNTFSRPVSVFLWYAVVCINL